MAVRSTVTGYRDGTSSISPGGPTDQIHLNTKTPEHLTKHTLKDTTTKQNKLIYNSTKSLGVSFDVVDFIMEYCPNSLNYFNFI